jgi:predicted alpha/beta hydrolase family esterase
MSQDSSRNRHAAPREPTRHVLFVQGAGGGAHDEDAALAASLGACLGEGYRVHYPPMPAEDAPGYAPWASAIAAHLAALDGDVVLVGHSFGSSVLARYLADGPPGDRIAGLFLLAAPFWGGDEDWRYDAVTLPPDAAARLPGRTRVFLYHGRADEEVPFEHLALYARALPGAVVRPLDGRGHQLDDDLACVAEDIVGITRRDG